MVDQLKIQLPAFSRGFHLITDYIYKAKGALPEKGMLNIFIQHTSAGITINENADPDVLTDFESIFNMIVPENLPFLEHTIEGPDDMPAHIKASLVGSSINVPISNHKFSLGTWQGIYLCEFRNRASGRKLVLTTFY